MAEELNLFEIAQNKGDFEFAARIERVVESDYQPNSVTIVLDKEIPGYNREGQLVMKSTFSKNVYELIKQVAGFHTYLQLADALSKGKAVNTDVFALVFKNAEIKCKKHFHAKDTPRDSIEGGTYPRDTFVCDILSMTCHINPMFEPFIVEAIKKPQQRKTLVIDPTNI